MSTFNENVKEKIIRGSECKSPDSHQGLLSTLSAYESLLFDSVSSGVFTGSTLGSTLTSSACGAEFSQFGLTVCQPCGGRIVHSDSLDPQFDQHLWFHTSSKHLSLHA